MRALIFELRPQARENEGRASALQKHADAVRARSGLKVHLKVIGERRLPIAHEEALYQIAREALHNVVKHAQAGEAWIDLDLSAEDVLLSIRDNGRGFDLASLRQGGGSHIGTSTMQERAGAINGNIDIESAPGKGTRVSVRVHIPEAEISGFTTELPGVPRLEAHFANSVAVSGACFGFHVFPGRATLYICCAIRVSRPPL